MGKIKEKKNNVIEKVIVVALFITLLFVSSGVTLTYQGEIFVKNIVGEKSNIILIIGIIGVIVSIIKYGFKFDNISILLLARFLLFVICNIIITLIGKINTEFQPGIILAYFLCFCYFFIGRSLKNREFLSKISFVTVCIILFQLILTYFGRELSYSDKFNMKWWMVIPLGQTNSVGCYLIGLMIYIHCSCKNKKINIITSIFTLVSVLLTYSRSGLLIYALYIGYIMLKNLKKNKKISTIAVILLFIMIGCSILFITLNWEYIIERFSLNSMSNTRIKVYTEGIDLFFNNVLLGIGAYKYHIFDAYKAHNWVLETLIENGIVGTVLFFAIIKESYTQMKKTSPKMLTFMIFYLIHGLVEPNLYTVNFDAFFWLLIGSCLIEDNRLNRRDS